jgi:hypothetical protein
MKKFLFLLLIFLVLWNCQYSTAPDYPEVVKFRLLGWYQHQTAGNISDRLRIYYSVSKFSVRVLEEYFIAFSVHFENDSIMYVGQMGFIHSKGFQTQDREFSVHTNGLKCNSVAIIDSLCYYYFRPF